jgi:PAS domain S-box-containing protein
MSREIRPAGAGFVDSDAEPAQQREKMRLDLTGRSLSASLILSVVYAGAAKLGLMLALEHPSATAVWPPTGIGLAGLLIFGYRVWPGIFAGAFVANLTTAGSVATSLGIATGNTLEGVVGCYLVTRFANGRAAFSRPQDVFKFTGLAALLATMVSASCGVASLALGGYAKWAEFGSIWLTWWLGDASGALIVAPPLLLWSDERRARGQRGVETLAAFATVAVSTGAVFGNWLPVPALRLQSLTLPALLWVAFRLGPREAATAVLMMSGISLVDTVRGFGPFAGIPPEEGLRSLQVYTSVRAVTALVIAAAISERRRLEEERSHLAAEREHAAEVRRSEARLRALLEAAPDPTVVIDENDRIVFVNSRIHAVFGYAPAELGGHSIETLVPEGIARRHAPHGVDAQARPTGVGLELHGRRRDGSQFPVEISLGPIQTDEGMLVCAAIRDLSERRRAEEARAYLAAIVDSTGDAIISERLDGTILTWNPGAERMYGYSAEEMRGRSISALVPPEREDETLRILTDLTPEQHVHSYETVRRRKDGSVIEVSLSISPIVDAGGAVVAASVIARDITERKRAEEALRVANEELETFAYSVSHDLRAPLRGIRGLAQALSEDYGERLGSTGGEYLRRLSTSAAQMDALTANLLTYSRMSLGDIPMSTVDLDRMAADALGELEPEIRDRSARVSVMGPLPSVIGYEEAIRQVIGNLVGNAIKFVPAGMPAEVTICAEYRGEWIRTWVIDNGIGIDPAYHERIFQGFERLHGRATYAGHGLGLAIAQKAASRMGGRVGVESAVGQGSRFWFELRGSQT